MFGLSLEGTREVGLYDFVSFPQETVLVFGCRGGRVIAALAGVGTIQLAAVVEEGWRIIGCLVSGGVICILKRRDPLVPLTVISPHILRDHGLDCFISPLYWIALGGVRGCGAVSDAE